MDDDRVVIVDKLTKTFEVNKKQPGLAGGVKSVFFPKKKKITALKKVSFSMKKGELVGFIGPNGAGKTTTIKILSGLLYPTSGFVQVLGFDPWGRKPEFLKQISLVAGQKRQLSWDLPGEDTFELLKAIYEIPEKAYRENLGELVDMLDARKFLDVQVRRLSLGQRMRLELIAALLHKPKMLFLDEPTIGLDLVAQQKLRDFVYEYNKKNQASIILTSHNMDDLADLAKRVIVIDKGTLIFDGALSELVQKFAKDKIINIYFSKEVDYQMLEKIGKVIKIDYPKATISVPRATATFASAEILQNMPVADLTIDEEPLESVIRRLFKGER